jgi:NAD dependent epimerase/dehydratase family enzyme
VTNADFTRALARVLQRPAFLPVPAWALRTVLGRKMANEALLASTRATPLRLSEMGFSWQYPTIDAALRAMAPSRRSPGA